MRVAGKPGAVEDRIDLAAQQRDVERRGVVRRGGPEAEEDVGSDAHLLHVDRSVHGGARVGLPHSESGVGAAGTLGRCAAGDAERCAGLGVAVAEEREVVVGHPPQQRGRLRVVGIGQRTRDGERPVTHRLPVIDGGANVAEHPQQVAAERLEQGRVGLAVDLEVHERLTGGVFIQVGELSLAVAAHGDDRMDDKVDAEAVASELHAHGVHEEGHVVSDDVDDGVRRVVAILIERRVVHAHERIARLAFLAEPEMRARSALEVRGRPFLGIVEREVCVVQGDEASEQARRHQCHPPGFSS